MRFWIAVHDPFGEAPGTELIAMQPSDAPRADVWQDYREAAVSYVRGHVGFSIRPDAE